MRLIKSLFDSFKKTPAPQHDDVEEVLHTDTNPIIILETDEKKVKDNFQIHIGNGWFISYGEWKKRYRH